MEEPRTYRKKAMHLGKHEPRNPTEAMFMEKYGTITPVPRATMARKNAVIVACILYIHQGMPLKEACKLTNIDHLNTDKTRKEDKWDEFAQELVQMVRPSNLSIIKTHDIGIINSELKRRREELQNLVNTESDLMKQLVIAKPGSPDETRILGNIKKTRELIDEVTGLGRFEDEMSIARRAGLVAAAKEANKSSDIKKSKGKIINLD